MSTTIRKGLLAFVMMLVTMAATAQTYSNRIGIGVGVLYERGFDATISVEHETKNHNAWEYFLNGYVKYEDDKTAGHITNDSFWKSYRTWGLGFAYKPCVYMGKNNYGCLSLGGSAGSDTDEFMGWVHAGYEHDYVLRKGWHLYWQIKTDLCINGKDLFRSGVCVGFRLPTGKR